MPRAAHKPFGDQSVPDLSARAFLMPPIAREGVEIIVICAIAAIILGAISNFVGFLGLMATLFVYYFFRDPDRVLPEGDKLVVAPADGTLLPVGYSRLPKELVDSAGADKDAEFLKISIFMSVFNVHVNRNPVSGRVVRAAYVQGKFLNANLDKASDDNERSLVLLETNFGKVAYVQIAGLVARRIVNRLQINDEVKIGERFGLIKFGSRLDVYLPADRFDICVKAGQKMVAGETILAVAKSAG